MITVSLDGVDSSTVGLYVKTHRTLLPELEGRFFEADGIDGSIDYGNNPYRDRYEEVDFYFEDKNFADFAEHKRLIADWLSRQGDLRYSDEPHRYYEGARVYQAIKLDQNQTPSGRFTAIFRARPFAKGAPVAVEGSGVQQVRIPIEYSGTAKAPCYIIIRNTGNMSVSNLTITHMYRR